MGTLDPDLRLSPEDCRRIDDAYYNNINQTTLRYVNHVGQGFRVHLCNNGKSYLSNIETGRKRPIRLNGKKVEWPPNEASRALNYSHDSQFDPQLLRAPNDSTSVFVPCLLGSSRQHRVFQATFASWFRAPAQTERVIGARLCAQHPHYSVQTFIPEVMELLIERCAPLMQASSEPVLCYDGLSLDVRGYGHGGFQLMLMITPNNTDGSVTVDVAAKMPLDKRTKLRELDCDQICKAIRMLGVEFTHVADACKKKLIAGAHMQVYSDESQANALLAVLDLPTKQHQVVHALVRIVGQWAQHGVPDMIRRTNLPLLPASLGLVQLLNVIESRFSESELTRVTRHVFSPAAVRRFGIPDRRLYGCEALQTGFSFEEVMRARRLGQNLKCSVVENTFVNWTELIPLEECNTALSNADSKENLGALAIDSSERISRRVDECATDGPHETQTNYVSGTRDVWLWPPIAANYRFSTTCIEWLCTRENAKPKWMHLSDAANEAIEHAFRSWCTQTAAPDTVRIKMNGTERTVALTDQIDGVPSLVRANVLACHGHTVLRLLRKTQPWFRPQAPRSWFRAGRSGSMPHGILVHPGSEEFCSVEQKLKHTLPEARVLRLERIQNNVLWQNFQFKTFLHQRRTGRLSSELKYLWHSTSAIKKICARGFDSSYAHRPGMKNAFLDLFAVYHRYGYGSYFAKHQIYSHTLGLVRGSKSENDFCKRNGYTTILACVLTGRSKDFGSRYTGLVNQSKPLSSNNPKICQMVRPPSGYDSVTGTEGDGPFDTPVHTMKGGVYALWAGNGAEYGEQYVVYTDSCAYPSYVVHYSHP